jgi:RNA polymerase sigma-70 factor (ECF subfamily)
MVSVLTKIFGTENLELAEDVVQETLLHGLQVWKIKGIPDNPSAWLYTVAKNKAIDVIRKNKHTTRFDFTSNESLLLQSEYTLTTTVENFWDEGTINDDLLRMMFVCCHPDISPENQISLILKTLCGFSTTEIAKSFLTSEETISKRLYRTKEFFRARKIKLEFPSDEQIQERTAVVLRCIYLLFNEGYNATSSDRLIRNDLITESMMLCHLLTENPMTSVPEVYALLALMCFHSSRSDTRVSPEGEIILLQYQDRSLWDRDLINKGNEYMGRSAFGNHISQYHIEAAIAFEHCRAEKFESTNWQQILTYYEWLSLISTSPVFELNQVVAVLQVHGPLAALDLLKSMDGAKALSSFYLYHAILGEVYSKLDHRNDASKHFLQAIELTHSDQEKKILSEKIRVLGILPSISPDAS